MTSVLPVDDISAAHNHLRLTTVVQTLSKDGLIADVELNRAAAKWLVKQLCDEHNLTAGLLATPTANVTFNLVVNDLKSGVQLVQPAHVELGTAFTIQIFLPLMSSIFSGERFKIGDVIEFPVKVDIGNYASVRLLKNAAESWTESESFEDRGRPLYTTAALFAAGAAQNFVFRTVRLSYVAATTFTVSVL